MLLWPPKTLQNCFKAPYSVRANYYLQLHMLCSLWDGDLVELVVILWLDLQNWFLAWRKSRRGKIKSNNQHESIAMVYTNILRPQWLQTDWWIKRYDHFNFEYNLVIPISVLKHYCIEHHTTNFDKFVRRKAVNGQISINL